MAVTGASGSFGRAMLQALAQRGASLVAITSSAESLVLLNADGTAIPVKQVIWHCGEEQALVRVRLGQLQVSGSMRGAFFGHVFNVCILHGEPLLLRLVSGV